MELPRVPTLGPEHGWIFRITHRDNVPWILTNGLHCQSSATKDPKFISIGMADLISKRATRKVDVGPGGSLSDYVPFYFTPWSIMLYNITTGYNGVTKRPNSEVVILVSSLAQLLAANVDYVFTSAHAYPAGTAYFEPGGDLNEIDWRLLKSRNFKKDPNDPGKIGRYHAEALAYQHVPVSALSGIACYDKNTQAWLAGEAAQRGLTLQVKALPNWYF